MGHYTIICIISHSFAVETLCSHSVSLLKNNMYCYYSNQTVQ